MKEMNELELIQLKDLLFKITSIKGLELTKNLVEHELETLNEAFHVVCGMLEE